jgi:DNA repair exonuclease SbcCD ATPase subunit
MKKTSDTPQLRAVLQHQQAIDAASDGERGLEKAVAECDQKLQAAREGCPSDAAFEKQLEDLAAAAATGQIAEAEARKREQEIAGKRDPVRQQAGEVGKAIERIERARKGLQRQLDEARSKLDELLARNPEVVAAFLRAEAEQACAIYVEAGAKVREANMQLHVLNALLARHAPVRSGGGGLLSNYAHQFALPLFNLPQCEGLGYKNRPGIWIEGTGYPHEFEIVEQQEAARIGALGVKLEEYPRARAPSAEANADE